MNWLSAISRKNRLKKYWNWWYRTRGRKDFHVYRLLLMILGSLIV